MLEYDSSHVAPGHCGKPAQSRHGIARQQYAGHRAAQIRKEDAQRRALYRSRRITALWSSLNVLVRRAARGVLTARLGLVRDQH